MPEYCLIYRRGICNGESMKCVEYFEARDYHDAERKALKKLIAWEYRGKELKYLEPAHKGFKMGANSLLHVIKGEIL